MPRTPTPARPASAIPAQPRPVLLPDGRPAAGARWRRFAMTALGLAVLWGALSGFRADALVFGIPAVLAGAALVFVLPPSPGWRISARGLVLFALWFGVQSVRGAVDVAARACAPRMGLRPGFRSYHPALPMGAPRVLFLNAITLLPGTLTAEIEGERVLVHMLDTRADLDGDLQALERRVASLFALT